MDLEKDCSKCVFRRFTFDENGLPTIEICHGKYRTREEAINAMKTSTCDMYQEGSRLYKDGITINTLPASKRYLVDRLNFSETPVAVCDHIRLGMSACYNGEGTYCYCRLPCTSQMDMSDPSKMADTARASFSEAIVDAGLNPDDFNI